MKGAFVTRKPLDEDPGGFIDKNTHSASPVSRFALKNKSFLLLFFKKEVLVLFRKKNQKTFACFGFGSTVLP
jgi:hypothetical protein